MKSKLTILLVFIWSLGMAQYVPNHDHITLGHIVQVLYGDSTAGRNTLTIFDDAIAAKFDPNYGSKTMNPQTLNGFRNYGYLPPTVTTATITNIAETTATGGGNVTSDGGLSVTARGVCWSQTTDPTTADSKTTDGSGTGSFTSSITGLTGNVLYYVRAYATNSKGTSYGANVSFTTTTGCTRPGGNNELILYSTIDGIPLTADNICFMSEGVMTGMYEAETLLTDGTDVYLGWLGEGANCTKVPDGYYFAYFNPYTSGDPYYMVYILGGKIYLVYC